METKVYLREEKTLKNVKIKDNNDVTVSQEIKNKWQDILDVTADLMGIKAALIMEITNERMRVFLKSSNEDNPYPENGSDLLRHGLYCETVIGRDSDLLIKNALDSKDWEDNPDIKLNMISYYGLPIKYSSGNVFGTICVLDNKENEFSDKFKNILSLYKKSIETDLKLLKSTNELDKKNKELEESIKTKNMLFSIISHDLRSPFNSILGLLNILKEDFDQFSIEETKETISDIYSCSKEYYNLLNNLLKWSQTQIDKVKYQPSKVKILELIKDSILSIENQANKKNIKIHKKIEINDAIHTDGDLLKIIILNLLNNAIKFTLNGGEVFIEVKEDKEAYYIKIKDTGLGIDEERIKNLFELKDNPSTRGTNGEVGTGLGLLIVKEFVDLMRGEIFVNSKLGKGTEFIVKIDIDN